MDSRSPVNARTERVSVNALKFQREDALRSITRIAEECGVRIDAVDERTRGVSVDIDVTVTGGSDQIASFCRAAGATPEHESSSARLRRRVRAVVNAILDTMP